MTRDDINHESVSQRLRSDIAEHEKYRKHDFKWSERIKWLAILLSGISTVLIALFGGEDYARWISIPALVSTVLIGTDKYIPFARRAGWHFSFGLALEELLLRLETEDADVVERARIELERRFGNEFPAGAQPGG